MTTLRIATLNIWGTNGPWPERFRLIRRELESLDPDVVGMQEVMRVDGGLQIDGLGYEIAYGPAFERQGNAILSRFPILDQRVFVLPVHGFEPRVLLHALLDTPHGQLPCFVTHLNWQADHGAIRVEQVRFIVERVRELAGDLPPVIMGDFNAEPDADEIRYLSASFADAWTGGGDGSAGATFDRSNDYARSAREPSRRIDYIFTGEPVRTTLAFHRPEAGIWPSDHFGVVTDVVVAP